MVFHGHGVGQSVGANGVWCGIINTDAAHGFGRECKRVELPFLPDNFQHARRHLRHHAAQGRAGDGCMADKFCDQFFRAAGKPTGGWDVDLFQNPPAVGKAEMGMSVADVK